MADIVVYGSPLSPFVRKVEVFLRHTGTEYDFEAVNIMDMPDWFEEISPARRIPVLRDRSIGAEGIPGTIADSSAICLYLDRKLDSGLYGESAFEAGRVAWVEEDADTSIAMPLGMGLLRPIIFPRFSGRESDLDTARKTWKETLPPLFDYLEASLDGGEHLVGGRFSLADIAVGCQLTQLALVAGLPDASRWPALVKAVRAMQARPEFAANLELCARMLGGILSEPVDLS
ncbi:MAG: glutathione S-transferase family protein [Pseudomonadales bacterium]|jgi:glutathione S-transferase|nr:glutathione S-transferase family protein [Pseudomonadales bacterium]